MTFENIARILLPKQTNNETGEPVTQQINPSTTVNPDEARARRNRLAELSAHSKPLKKAA